MPRASFRSVLTGIALNASRTCRVSSSSTAKPASRMPAYSHCDSGPASSPIRVELDGLRRELAPYYSAIGRPSVDPELMIRMLIVGYCFGIRSERRVCEEVHLNLTA
jgi:transposase-like protein DUF772